MITSSRPETSYGLSYILERVDVPTLPVIAEMEATGVLIDRERLAALGPAMDERLASLEESVEYAAGAKVNLRSPAQVAHLLYDVLGLPAVDHKNPRGTDKELLEKLALLHPAPRLMRDHRRLSKLRSTYVSGILESLHTDNRLYAHFNPCTVITGRLSSSKPVNLQNIPKRVIPGTPDFLAAWIKEIRKCFIPRPGWRIVRFDQAQVEFKILVVMSDDRDTMAKITAGVDIHADTVAGYLRLPYDEVVALRKSGGAYNGVAIERYRDLCKNVVYGTCYGQTEEGLADWMTANGLPTTRDQAKQVQRAILGTKPPILNWIASSQAQAKRFGYTETCFGRRIYVAPDVWDSRAWVAEKALRTAVNGRIQGSSADVMRLAMSKIRKRRLKEGLRAKQILAVHDECVFECPAEEVEQLARLCKEEAESVVNWPITLTVDVETGENWGECRKIQFAA